MPGRGRVALMTKETRGEKTLGSAVIWAEWGERLCSGHMWSQGKGEPRRRVEMEMASRHTKSDQQMVPRCETYL